MIDSPVDSPRDSAEDRPYSRWPDPWPHEDEWGPLTAAVMFFIILAGLIVYGSGAHCEPHFSHLRQVSTIGK
jgi:hypothetical protein